MAAAAPWPLDAGLLVDVQEDPGDARVRTPMRAGPVKMRALGTSPVGTLAGAIIVSAVDCETLMTWGRDELSLWTLSFAWQHPRTGRLRELTFATVPTPRRVTVDGDDSWYTIPINLEAHP